VAGRSKRPRLRLSEDEVERLNRLRDSRTAPWRETQRARIVLRYHSGESVTEIAKAVGMTRKSVGKWIGKALEMGSGAALKDAYHRPKEPAITEDAKAWVIHLACSKPKDLGYAAEVWTRSALARHVRQHAGEAGYTSLSRAAKATVHRILASQPLHPEKVKYYLERRDPEFESKMREVLLVYQEVAPRTGAAEWSR
jgi:transposase